jgi:diguanylate cyclase (GGDEF)-like protein
MPLKAQFPARWRFQASVLAPVVLSLLVTAATVLAFILWSTSDLDEQSRQRELKLAQHILDEQLRVIPHDQQGVTIWDDAIERTKLNFDPAWIDNNLGSWMYEFFGHDRTFVINDQDQPIFGQSQGYPVNLGIFDADERVYRPLIEELRKQIAEGAVDAYMETEKAEYPQVVDITTVADAPAIVAVAPIVSDTGAILQPRGSEYLLVSVVYLNVAFAKRLADEYLLAGASFTRQPNRKAANTVLPVMSSSGRIVGFFEWKPENPGQRLLARTGPVLAGGFVFAVILVSVLLYRLWRSSSALEAGRLEAQHQANHDALTGLANRVRFDDILGRTLMAPPPAGKGVALLMLDLDRFKQVNDTLGHQSGDDLIRAVGQRLKALVGPGDALARLGGDEFGVIHFAKRGLADHLALSQEIIDAVSKPFEIFGSEAFVGVSIGIVIIGEGDTDRREITRKADIALYEAKSSGRNRAVVYEEAMDELLQNRHAIEAELREALRRDDQLSVAFQPLYDGETGAITGAEALVRWTHPRLGKVSPAHFVPVAESTGLIEAMGEFVLRRACELGARHAGRTIAVNISPVQLRNPKFAERLFDLLIDTGMSPSDLELEITESILLDDEQVAAASLRTFRGAGMRIALDDFGTGYSSLNYLKRYPVDCIKIDRSFVSQLEKGSVSVAIVQAMVTLAHALDIEVTAEGVETEEQKRILTQMGCNTFQGFLLSAPVSAAEIERFFNNTEDVEVRVA